MKKSQINILSIDGGGIRGVIPATILAEIENQTGKPVSELFDIIAGTSTGGIISLGLTVPQKGGNTPKYSAAQLAELYSTHGDKIFSKPGWRKLMGMVDDLFDESYDHEGIEKVLAEYFGDARLSQALTQVLVTAYDMESREMFLFNSRLANDPNLEKAAQEDFFMRDIARATSAAPTYFEPKLIGVIDRRRVMVDGGVFANNPALLAYTEAKQQIDWNKMESIVTQSRDATGMNILPRTIDEPIYMLSLGTGTSQRAYVYEDVRKWGYVKWARPIIEIMMQGVSDSVHYQMERLLPPKLEDGSARYVRFNIFDMEDEHTKMDNVSEENIQALKKYAEKFIASSSRRIAAVCRALTE